MDERIRELAEQAGLKKPHGSDHEYIGDFDWRQFAELIVKDCAETVQDFVDHRLPASEYPDRLKRYFGIE